VRDWAGIRALTVERMDLHPRSARRTFEELRRELDGALDERDLWRAMKPAYTRSILGRDDFELAQTYFNSITRQVFSHAGVDPEIDYVSDDFPLPFKGWEMASARLYAVRRIDGGVIERVLEDAGFETPFSDLAADARLAAERIEKALERRFHHVDVEALDVLRPVFIRNKAAYVIGRARRGMAVMPIVLAVVHGEGGLEIDAVLSEENEVSTVFSFARWYFHADLESPREVIGFLQSIMPRKRISELYISLGHNKHGKTEFYRDLMGLIASAGSEHFMMAPGQRGQVMEVLTLPSYEFVFKIIKDVFPPSKHTTRREIKERYREVQRHDRVGRLVDFQEFEHVTVPRSRFPDELLSELLRSSGKSIWTRGDDVVIDHMYIGRRVIPLDLFVDRGPSPETEAAVIDWGQALKDLAAANIFTGDILLKNFGVTRHGRVVAYDYDELKPMTRINFRRFPEARNDLDELMDQPWFSVGQDDVFPSELDTFLGLRGRLREVFVEHHGDLFEVETWKALQSSHEEGEMLDFYPYGESSRLRARAVS